MDGVFDDGPDPEDGERGSSEDGTRKRSYTVPCASAFRDAVAEMAARKRVNVGDIARSILLTVPTARIAACPDPGEPPDWDRDGVVLQSGSAQGRLWRRKPRLQVRMAPGVSAPLIRQALALALALDRGEIVLRLEAAQKPARPSPGGRLDAVRAEMARLRAAIATLSCAPLPGGVTTREEALHVLGFPPGAQPDPHAVRARFRALALVHHPDTGVGDHRRMSQLNQAMDVLRT
jgi:hypothetical protein